MIDVLGVFAAQLATHRAKVSYGSANTVADPKAARLTGQLCTMLGAQGVPHQRSGNNQVVIAAQGVNQAHAVAERTLLSTGYRPRIKRSGNKAVITIAPGPQAPASADKPLAA
jgi:hypothetical protein